MNKTALFVSLALSAGIAIGLSGNHLIRPDEPLPSRTTDSHRGDAIDSVAAPPSREVSALGVTLNPQPSLEPDEELAAEADGAETSSPPADADSSRRIASLMVQLQQGQIARQTLERKLEELEAALENVDRRLTTLAKRDEASNQSPQAGAAGTGVDAQSLIAAGFSAPEAEALAQRWGEQQRDRLSLRDQAIREGWIDTPRYREAARDLREGNTSLREELGDDGYDRFLYATGQPNRLTVTAVFESSPAQISGLRSGDMILSYDGIPVRSGGDVRDATTSGTPGEPVTVEVLRNGEPIQVTLPRGPIGIQMDAVSVEPD